MRIAEIDKNYCAKEYGGDWRAMIAAGDCLIYTDSFVRSAFGFGAGMTDDLMRFIANNRRYCRFYDLDSKCFL